MGRGSYTGEFLLHIPCWGWLFFVCLFLNLGSFSYRSRAGFVFMRGVSLTHPVLALFFFYLGCFSYTSHVCVIFLWGVSLTHPILALFLSGDFLLHIPCLLFVWGVSLTHPIRSARKNRTRKKSAVEEVPRNRPEKNKRDEPFEQLKSTESLKRQGPENKREKRTKYIKTVLEIAKNGTHEDRKAKERARAE